MHALYAFMRHSDDLADDPPPGRSPREVLRQCGAAFERAIFGEGPGRNGVPGKVDSKGQSGQRQVANLYLQSIRRGCTILPAVVRRLRVSHPAGIVPGRAGRGRDGPGAVRLRYVRLIGRVLRAGGVGRRPGLHSRLGISRSTVPWTQPHAGLALQLTNILRDLREDAQRGRVYLPLEDIYAVWLLGGGPARRRGEPGVSAADGA